MPKNASHARQAAQRAAAASRRQGQRARAAADRAPHLRDELDALDLERAVLMRERDALVATLRAGGYSWADCGRLLGTTPRALIKRQDTPGKQ